MDRMPEGLASAALRVLVVEDEGLLAVMIEDLLAELGCEVPYSATSVGAALAWLKSGGQADGALLDVNLGGEAVFPLAELLAERGVPFAFTTGYAQSHDPRFSRAPYLGKPIRPERLAEVVRSFRQPV
jgi:CheY-like chemotaxis protein